jgi:superfamily II DNA or RNA helicase
VQRYLLASQGIRAQVTDQRRDGTTIGTQFLGTLTPEQGKAAKALLAHQTGVLAAATAFGKTVVAAKLIADRNREHVDTGAPPATTRSMGGEAAHVP